MSRLRINKLVLLGSQYKRTMKFDSGLTIIRGDRTSGKSLVLSLIDYCMGKSGKIALKVQKELDKHCDQIFLEVCINDDTFTLNRFLKQKTSKIGIYFCEFDDISGYTPKVADIKEVMQIVMRKLNINEYQRTKYKQHSTEQELETISFRDILRYVYVKQHALGTDNFLDNNSTFKKNKNPYAFEMIFNLVEADKDHLNAQLVNAKNNKEARKREIIGLSSYLEDKEAIDMAILKSESKKISNEINKLKNQKDVILHGNQDATNNENAMYIKLKNRLNKLANEIFEFKKEKNKLNLSISSKRFLLEEYKKEKSETDVTIEINYHLIVENQKIECPLCQSTVRSSVNRNDKPPQTQKVLNRVQREIETKMKLVKNLIEKDKARVEQIDRNISELKQEQGILNTALVKFAKDTSVPFLSQIDSINSIINSHNKKIEIINECIRIHRKIDEKNNLIRDLEAEIERLEKELKHLKVSEDKKKEILIFLNEKYKAFMMRLKYDTHDTYIDYDNFTPYHDGASVFEHESGGLLECMQISYLAAILSSKKVDYAVGHPGFLLLDSISKYLGTIRSEENAEHQKGRINDPEVYEEIYNILIELSKEHQLIIVDNTPPTKFSEFVKYTFLSGSEGLINLQVNEFEEED
ncbi:hypothetical protein M5E03_03715 [Bacillus safensis]|uniref:hypothetical protein n=1 Tax=Bacillus safensis TaxID=561879 RepID=UPI000B44636A|nr:hypothetical protein [Bacillus safensis]MCK8453247.1 hypothetical protein [Bacillus safensis]MCY7492578.1 hypothetical protein [Bacillus safensis]MED4992712.1 hypothetical protein [Bacillus safensis]UDB46801.1 hypothetical protein B0X07_15550 [Bacillus safensis]USD79823.1 hypothetical protein M5E03_03715 [Bacillus safensis]